LKTLIALILLCCCIALSAQAETFTAKVIVVMDGDTVMVMREGQKVKIRLANIDAPEKAQPFGKQSRDSLLQMLSKQTVQIDSQAVDQYGRTIGMISVGGLNVNEEQVRRGMAWEYSHYHRDETYRALQSEASLARRGLWAQNNLQAPWDWRKSHPPSKPGLPNRWRGDSTRAVPVMLYDMECGKKKRCSQMTSCDEARFYFTRCGENALDGNHDGSPCESLCNGQ
jgi:endonuclease YncB( thermonuclease family)